MKKKILVPIMALAMVVTAGVNYKTQRNTTETLYLKNLLVLAQAQAENNAPGRYRTVSCSLSGGFGGFKKYCCPYETISNCPQNFTNPTCTFLKGCHD